MKEWLPDAFPVYVFNSIPQTYAGNFLLIIYRVPWKMWFPALVAFEEDSVADGDKNPNLYIQGYYERK